MLFKRWRCGWWLGIVSPAITHVHCCHTDALERRHKHINSLNLPTDVVVPSTKQQCLLVDILRGTLLEGAGRWVELVLECRVAPASKVHRSYPQICAGAMGAIDAINPYLVSSHRCCKWGRQAQDTGQSVATLWSASPNQCSGLTVWAQTEFHKWTYCCMDALSP